MATEAFSGTEAISTTEWSMTTDTAGPDVDTTAGTYQLWLNLSDMVDGDELRIRGYEKVISTDAQAIFIDQTLVGAQSPPAFVSPAFILLNGWDWTLDAISGTITITWSIRRA